MIFRLRFRLKSTARSGLRHGRSPPPIARVPSSPDSRRTRRRGTRSHARAVTLKICQVQRRPARARQKLAPPPPPPPRTRPRVRPHRHTWRRLGAAPRHRASRRTRLRHPPDRAAHDQVPDLAGPKPGREPRRRNQAVKHAMQQSGRAHVNGTRERDNETSSSCAQYSHRVGACKGQSSAWGDLFFARCVDPEAALPRAAVDRRMARLPGRRRSRCGDRWQGRARAPR